MYEHVYFFSIIKNLFVTRQTSCFYEMIQPNIKLNVSNTTRRQSLQSPPSQPQVSKYQAFFLYSFSSFCFVLNVAIFNSCLSNFFPYALRQFPVSHNCGLLRGSHVYTKSEATTALKRRVGLQQLTSRYFTQRKWFHTSSQATITPERKGHSHQLTSRYYTGAEGTFILAHKPLLHPRGNLSSSAYNTVHLSRGRGVHTICQVHTVLTSCVRHGQQAPQLRSKMNNSIYLCKFFTSMIPNCQYKLLSSNNNIIICYCVYQKNLINCSHLVFFFHDETNK